MDTRYQSAVSKIKAIAFVQRDWRCSIAIAGDTWKDVKAQLNGCRVHQNQAIHPGEFEL